MELSNVSEQYTIDDYMEAKIYGVDVSIPDLDKQMEQIKISGIPLDQACALIHHKCNYNMPIPFQEYFDKFQNGTLEKHEDIYDKIIHHLILKCSYTSTSTRSPLQLLYDGMAAITN